VDDGTDAEATAWDADAHADADANDPPHSSVDIAPDKISDNSVSDEKRS
jgi:hypothetical protein